MGEELSPAPVRLEGPALLARAIMAVVVRRPSMPVAVAGAVRARLERTLSEAQRAPVEPVRLLQFQAHQSPERAGVVLALLPWAPLVLVELVEVALAVIRRMGGPGLRTRAAAVVAHALP